MRKLLLTSAAAGVLALAAPLAAHAEDSGFSGSIGASVATSDNIFAQPTEVSDTIYNLTAGIKLSASSDTGGFDVWANADLTRYNDNPDEDGDDYGLGFDGKLKFATGNLNLGYSHDLSTEDRRAKSARRDSKERTEIVTDSGHVGVTADMGDVRITGRVGMTTLDYGDVHSRLFPLIVLDQDRRDRQVMGESIRIGFSPDRDVSFFIEAAASQIDYDLEPPAVPHNRDSDSISLSGGFTFAITDSLEGEASIGWSQRSFDNPAFSDVDDAIASASLVWTASDKAKFTFTADRSFQETVVTGASIYVSTAVGARVDYKVSDRFALAGYVGYGWDSFQQVDRDDNDTEFGVSAAYSVTDNVVATLGYATSREDSEGLFKSPGFNEGRLTAGISASF